jgi:hypothetical protein
MNLADIRRHDRLEQPHGAAQPQLHANLDVRPVSQRRQDELEVASRRARLLFSSVR